MRKSASVPRAAQPDKKPSRKPPQARIHPVIIYPFRQPGGYSDLQALYELIARLDRDKATYARPITVMDRKTHYAMEGDRAFDDFRKQTLAKHSEVLDA